MIMAMVVMRQRDVVTTQNAVIDTKVETQERVNYRSAKGSTENHYGHIDRVFGLKITMLLTWLVVTLIMLIIMVMAMAIMIIMIKMTAGRFTFHDDNNKDNDNEGVNEESTSPQPKRCLVYR